MKRARTEVYTTKATIGFVPMGKMLVSQQAQRKSDPKRVEHLLSNMEPELIGALHVSQRDGSFYIMDGQHRYLALREWIGEDWPKEQLRCQIYSGLTEAQEADVFLRLNDIKAVGVFDKFEKAVMAGREREVTISKIVNNCGLKITRIKKDHEGSIAAVSSLGRIFDNYGAVVLANSLKISSGAFGDIGLEGFAVEGVALVCHRYGKSLDSALAIKALSTVRGGITTLTTRTNLARQKYGRSRPICFASVMVDVINNGLGARSKSRLPNWWQIKE